jgi:guanine deaminase
MAVTELIRARIAHTPANPFTTSDALVGIEDGGLLIADGVIVACGPYDAVRSHARDAQIVDWRDGYVVPGFVDAHVHFPQLRIIGSLGRDLLAWLNEIALPEEARLADDRYADAVAGRFVHTLLAHGTTSALVFGAHFPAATATLFEHADRAGLRLTAGLVLSDRELRPELHQTPLDAYRESRRLIERYHGRGRLQYAVTPRFALSTSEAMLEVCQTLVAETPDLGVHTHLNESAGEIARCLQLFPWASDYLAVYERFGLSGARTVFAHNVHPTDAELARLAASAASVAHCPCSNAALGSGIFPLRRHLDAGVPCALGTDVGAGTGFGLLKEGLQAYLMQRVLAGGVPLTPAHLLFLSTRAGALALGRDASVGDFTPGKAADLVYLCPPRGSVLDGALQHVPDLIGALGALFTLGGADCVKEVRIAGGVVFGPT